MSHRFEDSNSDIGGLCAECGQPSMHDNHNGAPFRGFLSEGVIDGKVSYAGPEGSPLTPYGEALKRIAELEHDVDCLQHQAAKYHARIVELEASTGCELCHGAGRLPAWDTDALTGPPRWKGCPNCSPATP